MIRRTHEIRQVTMRQIAEMGNVSVMDVAKTFSVSRQAIFKNLRELIKGGFVEKRDSKEHPYALKAIRDSYVTVQITPESSEDKVWNDSVVQLLTEEKENVRAICHYGFTEMFNNVIDHADSESADIWVKVDALEVHISITDFGVGIWNKLQQSFQLDDPRHALLELTKGKLTTDPRRHTGEGIFFTSRMVDRYFIASDKLSFCRFQEGGEYLFDVQESDAHKLPGTRISMNISRDTERTAQQVFDKFTDDLSEFGFTRTHLSVYLAKYEGDHLVSRSQAKRILNRLDKFKEVFLDFRDVTEIGQGFADEIFRVFKRDHPDIKLLPIHTAPAVEKMISKASSEADQTELPI
jgi:virulence-associated protein VapD/anti-sigma regulatory factor (Ser/Thr protein kinase)/predicted transcriptional regulator